jgi:hypothetical protein
VRGGVVARVTLATVVVSPQPLTRYAIARTVEERFGGESGILRTKLQHAYDEVPELAKARLIRAVDTVPTRSGGETSVWGATQAGVADWRAWLTSPITMPDAMTGALARLRAVRPGDYPTMLRIIDRYEAMLQQIVQRADDPSGRQDIHERIQMAWSRRDLVAQLQWCQHSRDIVHEEIAQRSGR